MVNTDLVSGILLFVVTALAWLQSRGFSYYGGIFVNWVLGVLLVLGVVVSTKGLIKGERVLFWEDKAHRRQVVGLAGLLLSYVLLIPWVGFVTASVLAFSVVSLMLTPKAATRPAVWLQAVGTGVFVTLVFYVIFKYALVVPLPAGTLFEGILP